MLQSVPSFSDQMSLDRKFLGNWYTVTHPSILELRSEEKLRTIEKPLQKSFIVHACTYAHAPDIQILVVNINIYIHRSYYNSTLDRRVGEGEREGERQTSSCNNLNATPMRRPLNE